LERKGNKFSFFSLFIIIIIYIENKDSDDSHKTRNKEAILNKYEENRIVLNDFLSKIQYKLK
jgi:hypothetical protein